MANANCGMWETHLLFRLSAAHPMQTPLTLFWSESYCKISSMFRGNPSKNVNAFYNTIDSSIIIYSSMYCA